MTAALPESGHDKKRQTGGISEQQHGEGVNISTDKLDQRRYDDHQADLTNGEADPQRKIQVCVSVAFICHSMPD